jgi:elongator complex protein 3
MRIPEKTKCIPPGLEHSALIRELHVYGQAVPLGVRDSEKIQHMRYGQKLLEKAEKLAKKEGVSAIAVIAGVGTREYYRRQGFALQNTYMVKGI